MNSDQRRYEQNNPHISNEMHHNHDASCGCGCQQGKYELNNEEYQNQNIANEQITQEYDGAYSYHNQGTMYSATDDSMQNDKHCNESSGYNPTQLNNPIESRRFQTITTNYSGQNRGIDALRTTPGQLLGADLGQYCRTVSSENQVVNDWVQDDGTRQRFLFYYTDSGEFVIANQRFGEVLTVWLDNSYSVTTELYQGDPRQFFRKITTNPDIFRLQNRNNNYIGTCGTNYQANSWTRFVNDIGNSLERTTFYHTNSQNRPITIPTLLPPRSLEPVRELTSLDDEGPASGDEIKVLKGNALIPAIFVNDVIPLQLSPYYRLEYRQYWQRTWSDVIQPFSISPIRETRGMGPAAQNDMHKVVDINIGADYGLRFGNKSRPFTHQITSGLNLLPSSANSNLQQTVYEDEWLNNSTERIRASVFRKAHEFVLTRGNDGSPVNQIRWNFVDDSKLVRTFPTNRVLTLKNQKIIKADNSYDLSVFKTPLIIKDGEVKIKNENKEYPCDE